MNVKCSRYDETDPDRMVPDDYNKKLGNNPKYLKWMEDRINEICIEAMNTKGLLKRFSFSHLDDVKKTLDYVMKNERRFNELSDWLHKRNQP